MMHGRGGPGPELEGCCGAPYNEDTQHSDPEENRVESLVAADEWLECPLTVTATAARRIQEQAGPIREEKGGKGAMYTDPVHKASTLLSASCPTGSYQATAMYCCMLTYCSEWSEQGEE